MSRCFTIAVTFALLTAELVAADEIPNVLVDQSNDHFFLSALERETKPDWRNDNSTLRQRVNLHHEICNTGENSSGLLWEDVGLAIGPLAQLDGLSCARRTQYDVAELRSGETTIKFQGGTSDQVSAIWKCRAIAGLAECSEGSVGSAVRLAFNFSILMGQPDQQNYSIESVFFSVWDADGGLQIRISSSDGFDAIAVALDPEVFDDQRIQDLLAGLGATGDTTTGIEVETFSFFVEQGIILESLVTSLLDPSSPVIIFRRSEESSLDYSERLNLLFELGRTISVVPLVGDQAVAVSELEVPDSLQ
jgi:hypothetical protein